MEGQASDHPYRQASGLWAPTWDSPRRAWALQCLSAAARIDATATRLDGPERSRALSSVESLESAGSGQNFHISGSGLPSVSSNDNTSPLHHHSHPYQHSQSSSFGSKSEVLELYCASCGRPWLLRNAFACTECICGVCSDCVGQIISSPVVTVQPGFAPMRRGCPRCGVMYVFPSLNPDSAAHFATRGGKWKRFQLDFR